MKEKYERTRVVYLMRHRSPIICALLKQTAIKTSPSLSNHPALIEYSLLDAVLLKLMKYVNLLVMMTAFENWMKTESCFVKRFLKLYTSRAQTS